MLTSKSGKKIIATTEVKISSNNIDRCLNLFLKKKKMYIQVTEIENKLK